MAKNTDPYADFGPGSTTTSSRSGAPVSNLSMPHLAVVVVGILIAVISGIVKLANSDATEGFMSWGPLAGVVLGFALVFIAGRKVKRFQD